MSPELGWRIAFTLGALLIYLFGTYLPVPGIDVSVWERIFRPRDGDILFGMLSGGGIQQLAIFALSLKPAQVRHETATSGGQDP
jgi:preprotein translocase subunit SecY